VKAKMEVGIIMRQNAQAHYYHRRFNTLHNKHNQRVVEFHKHHAAQIANGENGNGLLAKWERYVYYKGMNIFKTMKKFFN
jgi:hypothetical protein